MISNNSLDQKRNKSFKILFVIFNILFFSATIIFVFSSLVKINIINTKMFSPYGNGRKEYDLIKDELGEDFENFTKDDSGIKIYEEDGNISMVKIGDKEYKIK